MALPSLLETLEPWVDIPFNAWLSVVLVFAHQCAIRSPGLLLTLVMAVSATIIACDTTATKGEMAKTMCLLPLGLGSILTFLVSSRSLKAKLLPAFQTYVNFAVYGNIGMMIGTPIGGTVRGVCSKFACIALFIWIVQQGRMVGWKTVLLHDRLFVFTAVSKSWIFAHAIYRAILLTLPCFGSGRRHRLMEVYSLSLTYALSLASGLPFEYCFGFADTLVAPAAAGWSALATTFDLVPRNTTAKGASADWLDPMADKCLGGLLLAVAAFSAYNITRASPAIPLGESSRS